TAKPLSATCLTASALNSSVYCLLAIDTSLVTIDYGSELSTKSWPVQAVLFLLLQVKFKEAGRFKGTNLVVVLGPASRSYFLCVASIN
ncbi:hypothetical protein RZA67_16210, partial [Stenotrophomonas sp. C3(2023)]|uniref:hypothetical protein n=1 Tax=Stenotrophomonas sp. C3(2023) TaxID=3080277 RepID=UPI00293CA54B